jgi:hypothetical protein
VSWPSGCSALAAWLLSPVGPRLARVRVWGVAGLFAGTVLVAAGDMHGPPLLVGFGLGSLLLWWARAPASRQRGFPGGRGHRWPVASTTWRLGGATLGAKDSTANWKGASDA